jgi:Apea-like HEPN
MEKHSERTHRLLISTTSRLVGEYESSHIAITHAWPEVFPKRSQPSFGLDENPHSRNYYVLSLEIEDPPKEEGRLSPIPNYWGYGDQFCIVLSLIFGKRFDNHGFLVSHGLYGVPDLSLIRPTTFCTAGPNSHKPRIDLEIPLRLEEFGRVASLFTSESLHPRFLHILFAAGRFYLRSLQVFDYEPEFAYLDLVTSGEILANYYKFPEEELFDGETKRAFERISLEMHKGDKVVRKFKGSMRQIKRAYTLTITRLINDAFFDRTESTQEFGGLKKLDFERRIKAAYDLRSQYVHTGVDFGHWMAPRGSLMNEVQMGEPIVEDNRLAESLKLAPLYYGMERVMRYCLLRFIHLHGVPIDDRLDGIAPSPKAAHEDEKKESGSGRGRSGSSLTSDVNPNGVSTMNPQIVTIMCCHEAAHVVAAYRLRFPFRHVRFTVPVAGLPLDTDLGIDSKAMELAHRYLVGRGMSLVRYWGNYLAVLAIAKFANQH